LPYLSQMEAGLAGALLEQNQLDEALVLAKDAAEKAQQWHSGNYVAWANLFLAQILTARGDLAAAADAVLVADAARRSALPAVRAQVDSAQVRLWIARGELANAERWVEQLGWTGECGDLFDEARELRLIALSRVMLVRQSRDRSVAAARARAAPPPDPMPLLRCLVSSAQASGRVGALIEVLALQAMALYLAAGRRASPEAQAALARSLALAQDGGWVRVYIDLGEPGAELIREIAARGTGAEAAYAAHLLAAFPIFQAGSTGLQKHALIDPLTERESEVLRWLAAGFSNREIAERLVVSEGTVKTHVHNLLAKLGATSRTQALARARELGLL
jgi:LuxR family maltose regulon positive regulatory protein